MIRETVLSEAHLPSSEDIHSIVTSIELGDPRPACYFTGKALGLGDVSQNLPAGSTYRELPSLDANDLNYAKDTAEALAFERSALRQGPASSALERLREMANDPMNAPVNRAAASDEVGTFLQNMGVARAREAITRVGSIQVRGDEYRVRVFTPDGQAVEIHNAHLDKLVMHLEGLGYRQLADGDSSPIAAAVRNLETFLGRPLAPYGEGRIWQYLPPCESTVVLPKPAELTQSPPVVRTLAFSAVEATVAPGNGTKLLINENTPAPSLFEQAKTCLGAIIRAQSLGLLDRYSPGDVQAAIAFFDHTLAREDLAAQSSWGLFSSTGAPARIIAKAALERAYADDSQTAEAHRLAAEDALRFI